MLPPPGIFSSPPLNPEFCDSPPIIQGGGGRAMNEYELEIRNIDEIHQ